MKSKKSVKPTQKNMVKIPTRGLRTNQSGLKCEDSVCKTLKKSGYRQVFSMEEFNVAVSKRKAVFLREWPIGKGVLGRKLRGDALIFHPTKYPKTMAIEVKFQKFGGSVEGRIVELVTDVKSNVYNRPTMIVIDGGGYSSGVIPYLESKIGGNLVGVVNTSEFKDMFVK